MVQRTHPDYIVESKDHPLRTKVVCTIGPASSDKESLKTLINAGMNVARLNLSHSTHEFVSEVITSIRECLQESNSTAQVAIWVDTNGPKVRSGRLVNSQPVYLEVGQEFWIRNDVDLIGDSTQVGCSYTKKHVEVGETLYIDDGILSFKVVGRTDDSLKTVVLNSGYLGENKGINIPKRVVEDLPALSEKDRTDINFALQNNVDFISVSCIRSVEDVEEARILLGNSKVKLLAKIENERGMQSYKQILNFADGIVIDRGYLGCEVGIEIVTTSQKEMIDYANTAGKVVLVANQMLESMRTSPRPTRSEAADVANAVIDGADGLVLSGETAVGDYPEACVKIMRRIAAEAEKVPNYAEYQVKMMRRIPKPIGVSESIASSAVLCSRQVNASLIICTTEYGGTAKLVAKYRPDIPIVAATHIAVTARQLGLSFGVVPFYHSGSPDSLIPETLRYAVEIGLCQPGQIAVITSGQSVGFLEGTTTKMQVVEVPSL
ncbi:pyruvate kinase [Polychytrium aggregatum]|uniref:pyruvate kinase n=1 Tax=Polychytrium aggregatum TaxID=110093 RepID=UPI0022FEAB8E|nr:pyruvate kinase [Polychytrium aggregatum]KAI9207115.1 pyruvate kinase [Polychytrium aggregatum]